MFQLGPVKGIPQHAIAVLAERILPSQPMSPVCMSKRHRSKEHNVATRKNYNVCGQCAATRTRFDLIDPLQQHSATHSARSSMYSSQEAQEEQQATATYLNMVGS